MSCVETVAEFVVLLTPAGRAAVSTLAAGSPRILEILASCFQPMIGRSLTAADAQRIVYGRWPAATGESEEVVVSLRSADCVEVHCHGGKAAAEMIAETLVAQGLSRIAPHQWLEMKTSDTLEHEALTALQGVLTERCAGILMSQLRGALRKELDAILAQLAEQQDAQAKESLERLDASSKLGLHLTKPYRVVVAGKPNVGKSSLVNALLGYDRAIVFDQPGTTRDVVSATTALDGWPVELVDTAGLRVTTDVIEQQGVARAQQTMDQADMVLHVMDATSRRQPNDLGVPSTRRLVVINKCDLAAPERASTEQIRTSALTGEGVDILSSRLVHKLVPRIPSPKQPVLFTVRQVVAVQDALESLRAADFQQAIATLRQL